MIYDCIVVGSGCAGLTTALNLARSGRSVLVLESDSFGGQIAFAPKVENFPTIQEISGADFSERLCDQVLSHGAEIDLGKVQKIVKRGEKDFIVVSEYGQYQCRSVVLATGAKHRHLGFEKEKRFEGKGVGYCAVCDGAFYQGKSVCVLGDGNSALQYALYLANICPRVTIVTLFDRFFGDNQLVKRVLEASNIDWLKNKNTVDFLGEEKFEGLIFADGSELKCSAVFIAIGQIPDNKAFEELIELDKNGYIVAQDNCKTAVLGVYAAGDCRTKQLRQLTTAAADGATCAFNVNQYLG